MSTTRSKIVAQAQSWIGCKETDGSHKKIIDIYNGHKPLARNYKVDWKTDPWCATFISSLAIKLGATDIIPTECSCTELIKLFKQKGIWVEDDAYANVKPGDILLYDWQDSGKGDNTGTPDHIGIVEKVEGNVIIVIEGNINNAVGRRQININGRYIRGYAVPKYAEEVPVAPASPTVKTVEELALEVLDGKWGNGSERKRRLLSAGHDYNAVQTRVNEIVRTGKTIAELAKEVCKGLWGNGAVRKKALADAGYSPATIKAIQDKVNELILGT